LVASDVPEAVSDSYRLFLGLLHCEKPAVTGAFTIEGFAVIRDLLLAVRGSGDELAARPVAMVTCCPTSPLLFGGSPAIFDVRYETTPWARWRPPC
jgi:hypothetical protein